MSDDDELMAGLRRIADVVDPVPDTVTENARAALSLGRLDHELATLLIDSALQSDLVRGAEDDVRLLTFESPRVSVELQAEPAGDRVSVRGLVTGAAGEIVVESAGEGRSTAIDPEGWFNLPGVPHGATRMHLRADDGTQVTTAWVLF
jgi:hypothetical protein